MKIRMAQEVARDTQSVRRDIESFSGADACNGAGSDVAYGIAASFARGQTAIGKRAHGRGHVFELDEMKLDVFARGEMAAASGIFVGNLRQNTELRRLDHTGGDFHA